MIYVLWIYVHQDVVYLHIPYHVTWCHICTQILHSVCRCLLYRASINGVAKPRSGTKTAASKTALEPKYFLRIFEDQSSWPFGDHFAVWPLCRFDIDSCWWIVFMWHGSSIHRSDSIGKNQLWMLAGYGSDIASESRFFVMTCNDYLTLKSQPTWKPVLHKRENFQREHEQLPKDSSSRCGMHGHDTMSDGNTTDKGNDGNE